ncbi:MAG TPA: bifunctional DNA-formamidopyrimidine glycosylase/DNA-(apurinic or apyrimidinic site) lyase [Solirubrobacterales bacterium]|nr:bifunctional DNA-formamidopyrimidine glycosylase/DNA-(apurinic or apyrimidinic site) lyase [Solirubrobacterales bacterium]
MPELPEVETIRRQLAPEVAGRVVRRLDVLDPLWSRPVDPAELGAAVSGRGIREMGRRGKYLLLRLDGGETLAMHLRMTGNLLLVEDGEAAEARFLRARFELDDGRELWFTDARRFGQALLLGDERLEEHLAERLGLEPFSEDFTPAALGEMAAGRSAPLKSFLLDQKGVAGVGNIYADEALFRASLHPLSPAGSMRSGHLEDLHEGILGALRAGLDEGGASIDDYRDARGERGTMQDEFLVHTREGQACPRCGESIRRIVVSGRSTYFCPGCQVRLRRRRRRSRL